MVEMRRDWVDSSSEVHVVREIEFFACFEALSHRQSKQEFATKGMLFVILLMIFQKLQLVLKGGVPDHLGSNLQLVKPLRNLSLSTTI